MDREALERARRRLAEATTEGATAADVGAALEQAKVGLENLAQKAAELEAQVPERLGAAIEQGMRAEVLPVAQHIAEVRGLTAQVIRRLERLETGIAAERRERLEDFGLLVDLIASGWRGVEGRLDRIERVTDRIERALEERPAAAPVYRLEGRGA
ncbi:MAG: hypothetical protein ACRDON_05560 [Gaiellaceae bacterium]